MTKKSEDYNREQLLVLYLNMRYVAATLLDARHDPQALSRRAEVTQDFLNQTPNFHDPDDA